MNDSLQRIIALLLVALTIIGFFYHWWKNRKKTGCRGGCGCVSIKPQIKPVKNKKSDPL